MPKWDYDFTESYTLEVLSSVLHDKGKEGWELFTIIDLKNQLYVAVLKRPIEE